MHIMLEKNQVSLCQCAEHSVLHHMNMFYYMVWHWKEVITLCTSSEFIHLNYSDHNTAICPWTKLPCVWGVASFRDCELYNVLNTFQTCPCSQIHVCIVEYLSAINIYETIQKILLRPFWHLCLLCVMCVLVQTLSFPMWPWHHNWQTVEFHLNTFWFIL